LGKSDGSGDDEILGKDGGGGRGDVARKNGEVERSGFLEAASGGGEAETFGKGCFGGGLGHLVAPMPRILFSRSAMAARTESGDVPPRTFFAASAASTDKLFAKSAPNSGETFCNSASGSSIQFLPCFSASRRSLPTRSWAWRNGTPLRTR